MAEQVENPRSFLTLSARELQEQWSAVKAEHLSLDMTRGKPSEEQLDLSTDLLSCLNRSDYRAADGTDCRNYGGLTGILEAKKLLGSYLQIPTDSVIIGGNSSLAMMHDTIASAWLIGLPNGKPWHQQKVKFLCPIPGYDRHFAICEKFGIEMIPVLLNAEGPDIETVEKLVASDESIKGIWCVPKYSNPSGVVYSTTVIQKLASLKSKAPDFRVFWDNAYQAHHLSTEHAEIPDILSLCAEHGNENRPFIYGSTSKITLAGAGLAIMGTSSNNRAFLEKNMGVQTIGPDKINQLRHVRFFGSVDKIKQHMEKHRLILQPKFHIIDEILTHHFGESNICTWTKPKGGYFTAIDLKRCSAKKVVLRAAEAGVKLTPAGATHPYGNDPQDAILRIAPSMPTLKEVKKATNVLALCVALEAKQN
jgi:DNA-binding transcriptional MocR family regulator